MKHMTQDRIPSSLFLPQKIRNVAVYTKATFHVWYLSLSNVYICLSHGHILAYQEREKFAMIVIRGPGVPVAVFWQSSGMVTSQNIAWCIAVFNMLYVSLTSMSWELIQRKFCFSFSVGLPKTSLSLVESVCRKFGCNFANLMTRVQHKPWGRDRQRNAKQFSMTAMSHFINIHSWQCEMAKTEMNQNNPV